MVDNSNALKIITIIKCNVMHTCTHTHTKNQTLHSLVWFKTESWFIGKRFFLEMAIVVLIEGIYMPSTDQLTSASSEQIRLVLGSVNLDLTLKNLSRCSG